jgi:hypothetical protein
VIQPVRMQNQKQPYKTDQQTGDMRYRERAAQGTDPMETSVSINTAERYRDHIESLRGRHPQEIADQINSSEGTQLTADDVQKVLDKRSGGGPSGASASQ